MQDYRLTDTSSWGTVLEEGPKAVLRRGNVAIDTVDLTFGVVVVGQDSLIFRPVRHDTIAVEIDSTRFYESSPAQHVLWTPPFRRELRELVPFFDAFLSNPVVSDGSTLYYWGIRPHGKTNRLYAMQYRFRTAHLDSLYLDREDGLHTDFGGYLRGPEVEGDEVSFDDIVLDKRSWRIVRRKPAAR